MPELPEVETVRRELVRSVKGKRIEEVNIFDPSLVKGLSVQSFARGLRGRSIADISRRGKCLLLSLDNGKTWSVHLRMTGRVLFSNDGRPKAEKATRAIITLSGGIRGPSYLWFSDARRFGEWFLTPRPEDIPLISKMGAEPLEIERDQFTRMVKGKHRQIKALLLDQSFISGIGNIYACEALFRAGIHPKRKSSIISISNINRLYNNVQAILKEAIRLGGTSVRSYRRPDGSQGWFALRLKVYGREGSKCPRCSGTIRRIEVSGRGTYYCPGCQK